MTRVVMVGGNEKFREVRQVQRKQKSPAVGFGVQELGKGSGRQLVTDHCWRHRRMMTQKGRKLSDLDLAATMNYYRPILDPLLGRVSGRYDRAQLSAAIMQFCI
jgi:hypothetical protein